MKVLFLFLAIAISSVGVAGTEIALASSTTFVTKDINKLDLSKSIDVLPDLDATLTIADIIHVKHQKDFKPTSVVGNSFGFSKAAYWIRFSLNIDESVQTPLLLELQYPLLDSVTLFIPDGQNRYIKNETGDALPFSNRDVKYRNYAFNLPEQSGKERVYYMRLQTEGSMQFPLFLWSSTAFAEYIDESNLILGLYYGIMLLLFLIALASYFKIRDRLFLSYAFYLATYLLFQLSLNGFSFQYLWSELPFITSRATSVSIGLVVIGSLIFTGSFLQIWSGKHPYIKRVYFVLAALAAISVLLSIVGSYAVAVQLSATAGILVPPIVFLAAVTSTLKGYKPARFFLVAWGIFLVGVFMAGLLYFGHVPSTFITTYAMQIGSVIEILILGYALMYRFDVLRVEKENAVLQANAYLNQINVGLEGLVEKRTQQLEERNKELSELAIQDSMTGLLNHNASIDFMNRLQQSAQRYGKDLSVIMVDIDFFKSINDLHGHLAGDKVIIGIATILKDTIRESDICGRFGGEEFILILPESDRNDAVELAERIRENIQILTFPDIPDLSITASLGIAVYNDQNPEADLISMADDAMYQAKKAGKNQVKISKMSIVKNKKFPTL